MSKTRTLKQEVGFEASQTLTLKQKVCQKHEPLDRKSASRRQKRVPLGKKCVRNATPRAEIGSLYVTVPGQALDSEGAILNPLSLLLLESSARRQ